MVKFLIAPDKFKGSLAARAIAEAIAAGIRDSLPHAEITLLPIADGGEGTAEVICAATGGEWHECEVHDPLGRLVVARYCTIENGGTAVMEMSEASGLWRLAEDERDPLITSSFGTGEMLLDAAQRGAKEIIIGLGGSATNDGGTGMARALGFHFVDADGVDLPPFPTDLLRLARIEAPAELRLPAITAAVDVRNPLLGERGATRVFAPQKGAKPEDLESLERALTRLADVVGGEHRDAPGAGAAGGLGFALLAFCGAELRSGFDVVAERVDLRAAIRDADVIITGEGRLDAQTREGKAPAGVAKLAAAAGKRVFAIVGDSTGEADALFDRVLVVGSIDRAVDLVRLRARELARTL
ncbi:MAG TPA: glycerate kinase [Chthoniobacterales bacterium]